MEQQDNPLTQALIAVAAARDEVEHQRRRGQVFNSTVKRLHDAERLYGALAFDAVYDELKRRKAAGE